MATSKIDIYIGFANGTKQKISAGPYATNAQALTMAKAKIMQLNAQATDEFKANFTTQTGAKVGDKLIEEAHIITTERTDFDVAQFTKRF